MFLPCDDLLDNFNWNIQTKPTQKNPKKNRIRRLQMDYCQKKNDNEEGRVTRNEDDGSEMGEMIVFTPR